MSEENRLRKAAAIILVLNLSLYVFFPSLRYEEPGDDFREWLYFNERHPSAFSKVSPFTFSNDFYGSTYYRPVFMLFLSVEYRLFGGQSPYYALSGLLLHFLCSLLVYRVSARFFTRESYRILTAFFFTFHWRAVGALSWHMAGANHSIALLFSLLSLHYFIGYLDGLGRGRLHKSLYAFILACGSLESAASFILVLCAYGVFHCRKTPGFRLTDLGGHMAAASAFLLVGLYRYPNSFIPIHWGGRVFGEFSLYRIVDLATSSLIPLDLDGLGLVFAAAFTLFTLSVLVAFGGWRARFAAFWIFSSLLPFAFSNFRDASSLSRYMYGSSVGVALLLALLAEWADKAKPTQAKRFNPRTVSLLLVFTAFFSIGFIPYSQIPESGAFYRLDAYLRDNLREGDRIDFNPGWLSGFARDHSMLQNISGYRGDRIMRETARRVWTVRLGEGAGKNLDGLTVNPRIVDGSESLCSLLKGKVENESCVTRFIGGRFRECLLFKPFGKDSRAVRIRTDGKTLHLGYGLAKNHDCNKYGLMVFKAQTNDGETHSDTLTLYSGKYGEMRIPAEEYVDLAVRSEKPRCMDFCINGYLE